MGIIEITRVEKAITRWGSISGNGYILRGKLSFAKNRVATLATYFAAKEAMMKALGTGAEEVETIPDFRGQPKVYIQDRSKNRAEAIGLKGLAISLSHCREYTIASVIGETL